MMMTDESDFGLEGLGWDDLSPRRPDRFGGNFSIPEFKPWGSRGGVAAVSVVFTLWIVFANAFLIAVVFTSRVLRKQRLTPFIIQIALSDLAVGVFYCPLSADFYIKQVWTHGCDSLFIWNTFLYYTTFISIHCIGVINLYRLLTDWCRVRLSWKLRLVITIVLFLLLWGYLAQFGASFIQFRAPESVSVYPNIMCHAGIDNTGVLIESVLAYFVPAGISLILLIIILVREKVLAPPHQELNRAANHVISLKVLAGANVVALGMCLPCFITNVSLSLGGCGSLDCIHWSLLVATIFDWLLYAKSGVQPIVWLLIPDYKIAMLPVVRFVRRQPGMDTTELMEADDSSHESEQRFDSGENPIA